MTARLVFLHGFTQTHHHWHECAHLIAERLPDPVALSFLDLPGHGLAAGDHRSIEQAAADIAPLGGHGTYVGYSMGGRHLLAAAVLRPAEIERIVLIGANAGLADADDRAARTDEDERRARRVEEIGVDAFVDEWLAMPMFAGVPSNPDDRRHRCRNSVAGLAGSLRMAGTGAQVPLWDALPRISVPVLVLAGERDTKFVDIGRRIAETMPRATFDAIPTRVTRLSESARRPRPT